MGDGRQPGTPNTRRPKPRWNEQTTRLILHILQRRRRFTLRQIQAMHPANDLVLV
jgi:hypothetical protein